MEQGFPFVIQFGGQAFLALLCLVQYPLERRARLDSLVAWGNVAIVEVL